MKQSLKATKPTLSDPVPMNAFLTQEHSGTLGIAHCYPLNRVRLTDLEPSGEYTILVGPEGDFTEEEVEAAIRSGYQALDLGESRLRTETAGVHICSSISLLSSL